MLEIAGFELLPSWPMFLAFALAGLALNLVPGADMAYVAASAASRGRRAGITAALGVAAGALGHTVLAVAGISAVIASSPALFDGLKWLGAGYLLYLAVQLARSGRRELERPAAERSTAAIFRGGVMVNLLNPKVALFFVAFLPQFVDPDAKSTTIQMLALGIWFNLVGTAVNCLVAAAASGAAARVRRLTWLATAARAFAAVTFVALALRLAFSESGSDGIARRVAAG